MEVLSEDLKDEIGAIHRSGKEAQIEVIEENICSYLVMVVVPITVYDPKIEVVSKTQRIISIRVEKELIIWLKGIKMLVFSYYFLFLPFNTYYIAFLKNSYIENYVFHWVSILFEFLVVEVQLKMNAFLNFFLISLTLIFDHIYFFLNINVLIEVYVCFFMVNNPKIEYTYVEDFTYHSNY